MNCPAEPIVKTSKTNYLNIILFSLGMGISSFGSIIYTFAIGLYILKISGSGLSFATNLSISMLPVILLMPIGGVLADKLNKKNIVITTDLLNGLLFIGLFLITRSSSPSLNLLYATTLLSSTLTTVFAVTMEASKPLLVKEDRLMTINSIDKIIGASVAILGPLLGGLVFALLDIRMFIFINGLSFIFSAFIEVFIDFNYNKKDPKPSVDRGLLLNLREGIEYLKGKEKIITIIKLCIILNFFFSFSITVPLPYLINEKLNLGSKAYGVIQGGFAIGMILGSVFINKLSSVFSREKFFFIIGVCIAVCILFFSIPFSSIPAINNLGLTTIYTLLMTVFGIFIVLFDLPIFYVLQREVDEDFRGRIMGLTMSFVKTVTPLAFILSGLFIGHISLYTLPLVGSILLLTIIIRSISTSFKTKELA